MLLLFAGAGASKAIDPEGYPTTVEFFRRLPGGVVQHPVFSSLVQMLRAQLKTDVIDIEQWLWASAEARATFDAIVDPQSPAGFFFAENRGHAISNAGDLGAGIRTAQVLKARLQELESEINRQVFEFYRPTPSDEALSNTWIPLLTRILEAHPNDTRLEVFTTNYDVVLEQAIHIGKLPIDTGRRGAVYSKLDASVWAQADPLDTKSRGLLTKLHGSVDWSWVGEEVYFGTPRFQGNHEGQAIIYPGYKGVPTTRPFTLFHEHFGKSVQAATAVVFIGFAFRDEYINRILRDRLSPKANIVVLNPAEVLHSIPFSPENYHHIRAGFDAAGVEQVLEALSW